MDVDVDVDVGVDVDVSTTLLLNFDQRATWKPTMITPLIIVANIPGIGITATGSAVGRFCLIRYVHLMTYDRTWSKTTTRTCGL